MVSRFIKVRCKRCKNEQIVFEKPAMNVKCLVCDGELIKSTGGKGKLTEHAEIVAIVQG
ncbi:MAG TPA: 30S ribosomal protein S27e [Candidatus Aenigmarchaeota archaeon]|nr:MAG: 30S ribosomal protein S27e [Candidatus Aenigmarchaeota archaeon]HDD45913.1 30S ribosomal protein S27e [Candidatus Aenigmarchaeota archaeon]